jgi:single-strand DNA-binding protein
MASSINVVAISGNITRDSELRHTTSGSAVLNFSVAVNSRHKDKDGEWVDRASYIDCVMFGPRAKALVQWLTRGTHVVVAGELRQTSWDDEKGGKHSRTEVSVTNVEFQSRSRNEQQPAQQPVASAPQAAAPQQALYDEDIPF